MTALNISSNRMTCDGYEDMSGVAALADAMSCMGALLQLDISDNVLSTENERDIAKLCDSKGIRLTLEAVMPSAFGGGSSDY